VEFSARKLAGNLLLFLAPVTSLSYQEYFGESHSIDFTNFVKLSQIEKSWTDLARNYSQKPMLFVCTE
jgi:hypothetical protein